MDRKQTLLIVFVSLYLIHTVIGKKPSELDQGIFCEGCVATVKEILKKVNKKTGESREVKAVDAMDDICNLQNLNSYHYSPPKMGEACRYLIENYDEEIENIIIDETKGFEQKICHDLTKACNGVDRSKKVKEELDVRFNNEKQTVTESPAHHATATDNNNLGAESVHVDINDEHAAAKLVEQINASVKKRQEDMDDDDDDDDDRDYEDDMDSDDMKDDISVTEHEKTEL